MTKMTKTTLLFAAMFMAQFSLVSIVHAQTAEEAETTIETTSLEVTPLEVTPVSNSDQQLPVNYGRFFIGLDADLNSIFYQTQNESSVDTPDLKMILPGVEENKISFTYLSPDFYGLSFLASVKAGCLTLPEVNLNIGGAYKFPEIESIHSSILLALDCGIGGGIFSDTFLCDKTDNINQLSLYPCFTADAFIYLVPSEKGKFYFGFGTTAKYEIIKNTYQRINGGTVCSLGISL